MSFAVRRFIPIADLAFVAGAAALCAAMVSTVLARPVRLPELPAVRLAIPTTKTALDAAAVSQVTGLPLQQSVPGPTPAAASSSIAARILGTSVSSVPGFSLATVLDLQTQETLVVAVGDTLAGASVLEIERLRVTVDNHGRREVLDLEESVSGAPTPAAASPAASAIAPAGAGKFEVDRQAVLAFAGNPGAEMTKMFWSPAVEGGLTRGWRLQRLAPDSVLGKLGLVQGDVVRRINGFEVTDPGKLLEVLNRLKDATRIELEIDRNGAAQRLEYRVRG